MTSIAERLAAVRERMKEACRSAGRSESSVGLVAVSKRQPNDRLLDAYAAGQRVFGENYVQEVESKLDLVADDVEWHLIGHLQRNKAKKAASLVGLIHTVDSLRLGNALARAVSAPEASKPIRILVQVNIANEETKSGVPVAKTRGLLKALAPLDALEVRGLMAIPPPRQGRRWFAELRALRDTLRSETGLSLPELSMGMSGDFEDAIREGSTLIRVGTDIFGPRPD